MADGPDPTKTSDLTGPGDPLALVGGLTYIGAVVSGLLLDHLVGPPLLGPWAIAVGAATGGVVGGVAALLFGHRLEPPDVGGGGRALAAVATAVTVAAALHPAELPPAAFWGSAPAALLHRWWWPALMAAAPLPALIPSLALAPGETLHESRLRRASAAWFCGGGPPAVAALLALGTGGDPALWTAALAGPLALVVGALAVRIREDDMHRRGTRLRLAAVSWSGATLMLVVAWLREMAG